MCEFDAEVTKLLNTAFVDWDRRREMIRKINSCSTVLQMCLYSVPMDHEHPFRDGKGAVKGQDVYAGMFDEIRIRKTEAHDILVDFLIHAFDISHDGIYRHIEAYDLRRVIGKNGEFFWFSDILFPAGVYPSESEIESLMIVYEASLNPEVDIDKEGVEE